MSLRKQPLWRVAISFVLLAWVVRLLAAWLLPSSGDESVLSWRTIEGILQGHFFIYLYHNMYMFPLHEYLAAGLWKILGPSLFLLRIPAVIFGGMAAGLWWLALAPLWPDRVSRMALGLYLAVPSMANLNYEIPAAPTYAAGHFLIALLFFLILRFPLQPRFWHYGGLALFAGVSIYIFPLFEVPFGLALAWLAFRDGKWNSALRTAWSQAGVWGRVIWLGSASAGGVSLALGLYHFLTRWSNYELPSALWPVWGMAVTGLLIAAGFTLIRVRGDWKSAIWLMMVAVGAMALARIPDAAFQAQFHQLPVEEQLQYNNGADATLEHVHHWPQRSLFTLQRLLPQVVLGMRGSYSEGVGTGYVTEVEFIPWRLAVGLGVLLMLATGFVRGWKQSEWRPALTVLGGSVVVILILFCVTYKSANFYNYRYLAAFSPGLFLLLAAAVGASRWRTLFFAALIGVGWADLVLCLLV